MTPMNTDKTEGSEGVRESERRIGRSASAKMAFAGLTLVAVGVLGGCITLHSYLSARDAAKISLSHDGYDRTYRLYVSNAADASGAPLLVVLHGGGRTGSEVMEWLTGFNTLADEHGFLVAYPDGWKGLWNDTRNDVMREDGGGDIDDVGFIRAVVEDASRRAAVDADRVYATGVSNGGMMCHRLACEAGDIFSGIAPVIANMPANLVGECDAAKPMPIIAFNGTDDRIVRYKGGTVMARKPNGTVVSVAETIGHWRKVNGCSADATVKKLPKSQEGVRARVERWGSTETGAPVVLYTLEGAGHSWPGGPVSGVVDRTPNAGIDASRLIWTFFASLD